MLFHTHFSEQVGRMEIKYVKTLFYQDRYLLKLGVTLIERISFNFSEFVSTAKIRSTYNPISLH